jgi:hypothetical protein
LSDALVGAVLAGKKKVLALFLCRTHTHDHDRRGHPMREERFDRQSVLVLAMGWIAALWLTLG